MGRRAVFYGAKAQTIIAERFAKSLEGKELIVLDIGDNYTLNDPELVEMLGTVLSEWL